MSEKDVRRGRDDRHTPESEPDSPLSQVVDAIRNAGMAFVFEVEHVFGRTTTERRVSKRVHKVRWALEHRQSAVAPAQAQALAMLYGCVMPPDECARRLGITRQSFHERLQRGERRVEDLYEGRVRNQYRKGRPNARLNAPEGGEWMVLQAHERLTPVGARAIWGDDAPPSSITDEDVARWIEEYKASTMSHEEFERWVAGFELPPEREARLLAMWAVEP